MKKRTENQNEKDCPEKGSYLITALGNFSYKEYYQENSMCG